MTSEIALPEVNPSRVLPNECIVHILEYVISIDKNHICTYHKYLHMFRNDKNIVKQILRLIFEQYGKKFNLRFNTIEQRLKIAGHIVNKNILKDELYNQKFKSGERFKLIDVPAKIRKVLYFMSLAYGCIWYSKITSTFDEFGYHYYNIFDDQWDRGEKSLQNSVLTGKFLQINKIDNLEHYDVVEDAKNELDIKYRLKKDACIYKHGITKHLKEMDFVPL